jgi:soluble lytic murein transglycosylase
MLSIARLTTLALLLAVAPAGATSIDSQRATFRAAMLHAEAGRWAEVEPLLAELAGYPLLPDLRAAWLGSRLGRVDDGEVRLFLDRYPDFGFSAGLRRQWAESLARRGAWVEYLRLYDAHYAGRGETVLDCHAYTARIALGRSDGLKEEALRRWLSPVSQPPECDPAFKWLQAGGAISDQHRRERMALALAAGQFGLARWLGESLGAEALAEAGRWQRVHEVPAERLARPADWQDRPEDRALLLYGFHRLANTDPAAAAARWPQFRGRFGFDATQQAAVDQRIALMHAWRHMPEASRLLASLPAASQDERTREWAIRSAIRRQDWAAAGKALAQLDARTAAEPAWRYWQGRVLEAEGGSEAARPVYAELARERGYYSFLSADRLGAEYNWQHARTPPNEDVIAVLDQRADIVRARELYFTGLEAHGRSEWQQALARLSPVERAQAGILAQRWGWYSRGITAATGAGVHDDLDLRFPLPWRPVFEAESREVGISSAWAYGVARSESLFMPDVSSGAGAVGLMQLLPDTGRQTAQRAGLPYRGQQTLLDPAANVALGTRYLAEMLARYQNHRVLATAAYNAGPGRVDRWLPEDESLPADAWVDSVPFNETRGYVQRVLASEAVFQWRLSGETLRLAEAMQPVPPRNGAR